jgi:hypothetical protein
MTFSADARVNALALMVSVVACPEQRAAHHHRVTEVLARIERRCRQAERDQHAGE